MFSNNEILGLGAKIYKKNFLPLVVAGILAPPLCFCSGGILSFSILVGLYNLLRNSTYTEDGSIVKGEMSDLWIGFRPFNPLTLAHGLVWWAQCSFFSVLVFPFGGFYGSTVYFFAPFYTCEDLLDRSNVLPRMFSQTYFESKAIVLQSGLFGPITRLLWSLWVVHFFSFLILVWFGWVWVLFEMLFLVPWTIAVIYAAYFHICIRNNVLPVSSPSRPPPIMTKRLSKEFEEMEEGKGSETPKADKKNTRTMSGRNLSGHAFPGHKRNESLQLNDDFHVGTFQNPKGDIPPSPTSPDTPKLPDWPAIEEEVSLSEEDRTSSRRRKQKKERGKSRSPAHSRSRSSRRGNRSDDSGSDHSVEGKGRRRRGKGRERGRRRRDPSADSDEEPRKGRRRRKEKKGRPSSRGRSPSARDGSDDAIDRDSESMKRASSYRSNSDHSD